MTEHASTTSVRERLVRVLLLTAFVLPIAPTPTRAQQSEPVAISLADAAKLAAK